MIFRTIMFFCLSLLTFSSLWAVDEPALKSQPAVAAKETDNRIEAAKAYLLPRLSDGTVNVWVYFTDKGVFDKAEFDRAAAMISLTDRARTRRAKVGLENVTFGDLPVSTTYIKGVENLGATLRRTSRWLNAASFAVSPDRIDAINGLSFVAKIRPVALYSRPDDVVAGLPGSVLPVQGDKMALNYGPSLGQLNQIRVPEVHARGFNGAGILVAMFDTGFRKDHQAFATAYTDSRVLAEYDFIFNDYQTANEAIDIASQWNHGTYTWSTLGGAYAGSLYGPAYGASFILAKTEDVRTETQIEEDNWARAVEWADSIGADVMSSSLGYSDWYTYANFNGETAVTTIAANLAASYGIVVCNSMGNAGPNAGTLSAPADAFEILSCGAVNATGTIASFSSRGPTYDGRIKPEVCAQGVATYCASAGDPTYYTSVGGTSLSTPLVGGCAAVLLSARPSLTPHQVRLAFMQTADRASSPNNTYGWGILNLAAALDWGAKIGADVRQGPGPLTVQFSDSSYVPTSDWVWLFGDGDSSVAQSPVHTYAAPGVYPVSFRAVSDGWDLSAQLSSSIVVLADTLTYSRDTVLAGEKAVIEIALTNTQPLDTLYIPVDFSQGTMMTLDSISVQGTRTAGYIVQGAGQSGNRRFVYRLVSAGTALAPGSGLVARLHFATDPYAVGNSSTTIDTTTIGDKTLKLIGSQAAYVPTVFGGAVVIGDVIRGDANGDSTINVGDAVFIINYIFKGGPAPLVIENADANSDFTIDTGDAVFIINYLFKDGPAPNGK